MAKTWECDNCDTKMGVGHEAFDLQGVDKLFCSRRCAERWVQEHLDEVLDALDGGEVELWDEY